MKTFLAILFIAIIFLQLQIIALQTEPEELLSPQTDYDATRAVIDHYEHQLDFKQAQLNEKTADAEHDEEIHAKFIGERCVCVPWNSSSDEPALSKDQICVEGE